MYNLLISYYFSILFDVLHEKFGLNPRASIIFLINVLLPTAMPCARCIFFLPGIATQSICADLLGILEEILSYGIGGLFTPLNSCQMKCSCFFYFIGAKTIQPGCARHGRVYNVFLHEPFFVDSLNRVVLGGKPVD